MRGRTSAVPIALQRFTADSCCELKECLATSTKRDRLPAKVAMTLIQFFRAATSWHVIS
jgi:hypothetical protein